jgi:hypothetical protein
MLFIVGPYRSMCALTADMACWLSSSIPSLFPTVSDMSFHQVCNGQGRELSDTPLTHLVPMTAGACRCAVRLNTTVHHIGDAIYGLHSKWATWYCHRHHGPQLQARLASVTALLHLRQLHASWHGIIIPLQSLPWPPQARWCTEAAVQPSRVGKLAVGLHSRRPPQATLCCSLAGVPPCIPALAQLHRLTGCTNGGFRFVSPSCDGSHKEGVLCQLTLRLYCWIERDIWRWRGMGMPQQLKKFMT